MVALRAERPGQWRAVRERYVELRGDAAAAHRLRLSLDGYHAALRGAIGFIRRRLRVG